MSPTKPIVNLDFTSDEYLENGTKKQNSKLSKYFILLFCCFFKNRRYVIKYINKIFSSFYLYVSYGFFISFHFYHKRVFYIVILFCAHDFFFS